MALSLVIRGGTVYDGGGGPPVRADVGIDGDRIAAVGELPGTDAPELDATGLVVTPGFINILSHSWGVLQLDGRAASESLQGVTTQVFGEAFSLGPFTPETGEVIRQFGLDEGQRMDFPRLSEGLSFLEKKGVAPNVASFVGGHNLRILGGGLSSGRLSEESLDRIRSVLDEEMADGALGVGTALIYPPGCFADTDELVALSEVIARHDGLYISHMRSEGDQLLECLDELIRIGQSAGVRTEVYHLKAAGRANWPKMAAAVERIQAARDSGQVVGANKYPYTAGGTALAAAIPPRYHDGGPAELARRLADDSERRRIAADLAEPADDWENLYLASGGGRGVLLAGGAKPDPATDGRTLADVAAERRQSEAEALMDIARDNPTMGALYFIIDEANIELGLSQPWVSIGSDAAAMPCEPPWLDQPAHPRAYGTFARFLGRYVRDRGLMTLAEGIRRMTSLPADVLRLTDRGRLRPGAFADVVVLDPAQVGDRSTYEQPHAYAEGVRHVLVNGEAVVSAGELTGALPGRRLRRGG